MGGGWGEVGGRLGEVGGGIQPEPRRLGASPSSPAAHEVHAGEEEARIFGGLLPQHPGLVGLLRASTRMGERGGRVRLNG